MTMMKEWRRKNKTMRKRWTTELARGQGLRCAQRDIKAVNEPCCVPSFPLELVLPLCGLSLLACNLYIKDSAEAFPVAGWLLPVPGGPWPSPSSGQVLPGLLMLGWL